MIKKAAQGSMVMTVEVGCMADITLAAAWHRWRFKSTGCHVMTGCAAVGSMDT
jgi:hypothetical protein